MPVGHVVSTGPNKGKEVYLESFVLRELAQDMDLGDAKEEIKDELKDRSYIIIKEVEVD